MNTRKSSIEQLDKLEKALEEDHLSPDRLELILDIVEGVNRFRFYNWYTSLDIKGIFLDALTIQMRLDHGHDVDFDLLHTSDYKTCWNKVLDGYMKGRRGK